MDLIPQHIKLKLTKEDLNYLHRHSSRILATLSLVKSFLITSILDVGSGSGGFLLLLPHAWKRVAVDSPPNAELAKERGIDSVGLDLEREELPLNDNMFELVTLLEVIEHIRNKKHLLSEIYRVLKENGHLVVTTPDARIPIWRLRDLILDTPGIGNFVFRLRTGRFPDRFDKHRNGLSENELMELITSEGFVIVRRVRFKIFQPADDIVVICRKVCKIGQSITSN
jgi:SAM-dependent methyltransferase